MKYAGKQLLPRLGFTLVELLVSLALIMFIMAILSQAFVTGMDTFRDMKGVGDMEERLRSATQILRRDLAADHFEGRRRLSDPSFWNISPREGFFRIYQGDPSFREGADLDAIPSYRSPVRLGSPNPPLPEPYERYTHAVHFTAKLRGNRQDKFFSANAPIGALFSSQTTFFGHPADAMFQDAPGVYNSPWAELAYSLRYLGESAGSTPLFALYRHQRVVVPDNRKLNYPYQVSLSEATIYGEMAWTPSPPPPPLFLNFLNPSDLAGDPNSVTTPPRRSIGGPNSLATGGPPFPAGGATLLLTNVISFNVRVLKYDLLTRTVTPDFDDLIPIQPTPTQPPGPWIFDTYSPWIAPPFNSKPPVGPSDPPLNPPYLIKALQISIRVWDAKTQQARQVTIVQDM